MSLISLIAGYVALLVLVVVVSVWFALFKLSYDSAKWPEPKLMWTRGANTGIVSEPKATKPITPLGLGLLDKRDAEIKELAAALAMSITERDLYRKRLAEWRRDEQKRIGVTISRAVFRDRAREANRESHLLSEQRDSIDALRYVLRELVRTSDARPGSPCFLTRQRALDLLKKYS